MSRLIKICGLKTPDTVAAAVDSGADMVGFVFFAPSPRNVDVATAAMLADQARGRAEVVALVVDADNDTLEQIVEGLRPDLLQLHGSETPARAVEIRTRFGLPVMKALRIATAADLAPIAGFESGVDRLLFDAKAPPGALPGGNGVSFDWTLIAGLDVKCPCMLSGGLTVDTVADAIRLTGTRGVDVSSGVERHPGEKDIALIEAFIAAARSAV